MENQHLIVTPAGSEYLFYDGPSDGQYFISWMSLGLDGYYETMETLWMEMEKYTGPEFGGGFLIHSDDLDATALEMEAIGLSRVIKKFFKNIQTS